MKQVFLEKGNVRLFETEQPVLGVQQVLVRVAYSFISSGTESATVSASRKTIGQKFIANVAQSTQKLTSSLKENGLKGTVSLVKGSMTQVMPIGYSCSGIVVQVGANVTRFKVGDMVACGGAGKANHAEMIVVSEYLAVPLTNKELLCDASITTIGAIALQGIRRAQLQLGEQVAVIGLGLLGQLTVQLAALSGCKVYGVDIQDDRIELARRYGAHAVFNSNHEDWLKSVMFATHHRGVDAVIITAAGSTGDLINQALHITRRKGKVVLVGDVKLNFDREHLYTKEIDFLISCSYGPGRYDPSYEEHGHDYPYAYVRWTENRNMEFIADLIESKKLIIQPLIQAIYDLNAVETAYKKLENKQTLGIVLQYPDNAFIQDKKGKRSLSMAPIIRPYKSVQGDVNVAVIGAGGFCKVKLLPILSSLKKVKLHSVIDVINTHAFNAARQFTIPYAGTDERSVIENNDIHAVVIATPHEFHAEQIIKCLQAGKAVLAEKPAAVNRDQLKALTSYINDHPDSMFALDFNRSYSPFMQKIKGLLSQRTTPVTISYRMNVGHLPTGHWSQSQANGGRIIGEACHIFELFCFLTDATPVRVAVTPLSHNIQSIPKTDNLVASVHMSDGSVCTLTFTSTGSPALQKEYMELFFDGKSILMNDYRELKGYGLTIAHNHKTAYPDKGHEALFKAFFQNLQAKRVQHIMPHKRILIATDLALTVHELAFKGGGIYSWISS